MAQDAPSKCGKGRARRLRLMVFTALMAHSWTVGADCTSPAAKEGAREYVSSEFRFCDGTRWVSMYTDTTAGACTVAGRMDWESAQSVYRYCNGSTWYRMRKPACTISSLTYQSKVTDATNLYTAFMLDISENGTLAYVGGQWSERVAIYDISSSPSAPSLVGVTSAISWLNDSAALVKKGNYVFSIGRTNKNFVAVNVSNPASPSYAGRYTAGSEMTNIWGMTVDPDNDVAFTASWGSGASSNKCYLHAINTSNPASPTLIGKLNLTDAMGTSDQYCTSIKLRNGYLFIAMADGGIVVVDASNPASMSYVAKATASFTSQTEGLDLMPDSKTLVTSTYSNDRIHTWNVSNPASPSATGALLDAAKFSEAFRLKVLGSYALVLGRADDTISAVNLSNPASPTVSASYTSATNIDGAFSVATSGRYAYVTGIYGNSLAVIDMGCDPLGSAQLGSCTLTAAIQYFPDIKATAYCDGTYWRMMGYSQYQ